MNASKVKVIILCAAVLLIISATARAQNPVYFADSNLKAVVVQSLGISDPNATEMLKLTHLNAGGRDIVNLTGLEYAVNLQVANLQFNSISDISPLSGLTALVQLNLENSPVSDISPLSGLTALTGLTLKNNLVSDISPLSGLTNLRYLILWGNQIINISALSGLTNMLGLWLSSNQITDISPISGLSSLTTLCFWGNHVTNISALSGLTNLEYLNMHNNMVSDISPLSGLTNLTTLYAGRNEINNINAISGLTNLTGLRLPHNDINDINPISGLINLTQLWLEHNDINDINPISGLINLTQLRSHDNQISDISALLGLTNLWELWLDENPLDCYAYLIVLPLIVANNPGIDIRYDPEPPDCFNLQITAVRGDVTLDSFKANLLDRVRQLSVLETGSDGYVRIGHPSGSEINMAPNSRMQVDGSVSKTKLEFFKGKLMEKVKNLSPGAEFNISTPVAVDAVRGTELTVEVAEDGTSTFIVLDGLLELSDLAGTKTIFLGGNQGVIATAAGLGDPFTVDPSQIDKWWEWGDENTPPGQNVVVSDPETGTTISFSTVEEGGETTVTLTDIGEGPPPPSVLELVPLGTYYDINTTAEFSGMVQITIEYDDTGLKLEQENNLKLRQYDEKKDEWVDITTSLDTVNNIIYGETNHLSLFAITTGILVEIDIKPGSYPNAINLGSQGVIPVAILSSSDFDATTVDPDTVELAGAGVAMRGKGDKYLAHEEDVNGDGLLDLVFKVEIENLDPDAFQYGFVDLTGQTYDGVSIKGEDEIIIVPPEE